MWSYDLNNISYYYIFITNGIYSVSRKKGAHFFLDTVYMYINSSNDTIVNNDSVSEQMWVVKMTHEIYLFLTCRLTMKI